MLLVINADNTEGTDYCRAINNERYEQNHQHRTIGTNLVDCPSTYKASFSKPKCTRLLKLEINSNSPSRPTTQYFQVLGSDNSIPPHDSKEGE